MEDWKERLKAEYAQLKERIEKLHRFNVKQEAAYRLARAKKCLKPADLLPVIQSTTDHRLQYRLSLLITKDGIWPAMPYLLRFLSDYPKLRQDLYYLIWKRTREKAYVSEELAGEISSALAYARASNAIPVRLNNQICFQHCTMRKQR